MKKKLFLITVVCICLSFIALDCPKHLVTIPVVNPPGNHHNSLIIYSTNDGETWENRELHVNHENVAGISSFTEGNFGIIADSVYLNGLSVMMKTTNYGLDWKRNSGFYQGRTINDIYSAFDNKGFFVGQFVNESGIYTTADAGSSWSAVQNIPVHLYSKNLWRIDFDDYMEQGIIIPYTPSDSILISSDGGLSWLSGTPIYNTDYINDIAVIGEDIAIACGNSGRIFMTTNFGVSWNQRNSPTNAQLNSISFNGSNGIIVGNSGAILKSTNYGFTWVNTPVSYTQNLTRVFAGNQFGRSFACGDNIIISSIDYFSTSIIIRNNTNEYFTDISGSLSWSMGHIFAVGYRNSQGKK